MLKAGVTSVIFRSAVQADESGWFIQPEVQVVGFEGSSDLR